MKSNTDEFGGYSKPKWTDKPIIEAPLQPELLDTREEDSLCKLVGIDIEQKLQDLLKTILPNNSENV